jgi:Phosphoinositide phospholipase C, Ca2+-dependent
MKITLFALLISSIFAFTFAKIETDLPINHYQCIGSHNSYKEYIDPQLIKIIDKTDTSRRTSKGLEYHHIGLSEQMNLGLRALEIDIYADEKGGKYANPRGLDMAGKQANRPYDVDGLMKEPGFKVLHVQEIDFRSNCLTFKKCLTELKSWSDSHPNHEPIYITMNAKDDTIKLPGFTKPEKFTAEVYDQLDNVILSILGKQKLIIPDDIRGNMATLEEAVLKKGWGKMSKSKGRFLFVLDESKSKTDDYIKNHPSLKGRVLFTNSPVGSPEAAFLIMNDAIKDLEKIKENVKKGYIVRTRADGDTRQARTNDYRSFEAAKASGAQIISTDYYLKSTLFPSDYSVSFEGKMYFRKNPLF